jgi:hypothetical protein
MTFPKLAVALAVSSMLVAVASAQEQIVECKSVDKIATVAHSPKLLVNVARDGKAKACHFSVSLPPPNSLSTAVDAWFKGPIMAAVKETDASRLSEKMVADFLSDIIGQTMPKPASPLVKDVMAQVYNNQNLAFACVVSMVKKAALTQESKDGSFRCSVPSSAEFVMIEIRLAQAEFLNTIFVPRPV